MTCPHTYESHDLPAGEVLRCSKCGEYWDGKGWPHARRTQPKKSLEKTLLYIAKDTKLLGDV